MRDFTPMNSKKKPAFTLAEVLITLGIIGVVAAMTIPTLINNYQKKQTVVKLQKAISIWNNVYKASVDENGEPTVEEQVTYTPKKLWEIYYAPYITATTCNSYSECGYSKLNPFTRMNNTTALFQFRSTVNIGIYTNDGFFYDYQFRGGSGNIDTITSRVLHVDVNGPKGPNKYGIDVFMLLPYESGNGFYPACSTYTNEAIDNDCRVGGMGYCCAEKIRRAGWQIDKSYPWVR
jgi:prepilin-type N-terminal cleavage/methylation domain-containing protein